MKSSEVLCRIAPGTLAMQDSTRVAWGRIPIFSDAHLVAQLFVSEARQYALAIVIQVAL